MATGASRRGVRVLSLDGGGVKGLSELMILEYLMKSIEPKAPPKPCDIFDIIGGTSTGGLIAIMLGRLQMTVTEAIDAYLDLSEKCFAPKHTFNFVATLTNLSQAKGRCDSGALEANIKSTVAQKLGKSQEDALLLEEDFKCRVFVCSIRADLRSLICFRNYPADNEMDLQPKIWEAARATSAATTFFDPITIGKYKQEFVDGGGGNNNPVQVAFDEAKICFPSLDIECLVSIGAGKGEVTAFGRNLKQVGKTLVAIATDTDNTATTFAQTHQELGFEGTNQRLFRFQVEHGMEKVGMAEHEKIKDIAAATQVYMQGKDERGTKQLQIFKALLAETEPLEPETKVSSVELEPEKIQYIEKCGESLQITVHKQLLSRKPDYSSASIKLPSKIFCSEEAHEIDLDSTSLLHTSGPVWNNLLSRYKKAGDGDCFKVERWETFSVQTAAWYSGFGGSFAAEFPVTEIWRLISSYPPNAVHHDWPPSKLFVGDLLITVPDSLQGKPLVRVELRDPKKVKFLGFGRRPICNENIARAMCGGLGLPLDQQDYKTLYDSDAEGWKVVPLPDAFAFTKIRAGYNSVFCVFAEHYEWAREQLGHMMRVCHFLWDHADSFDCNEEGVPVKIFLEDLQDFREVKGDSWSSLVPKWKLTPLEEALRTHLNGSSDFYAEGYFIEIEDAVVLLKEADKYTVNQTALWDEDGKNNVVDNWWGRFGADRARWIALDMTLKMIANIANAVVLPPSFTPLLHSPSGGCFLV